MAAPTSAEALLLCFNQTHTGVPDTDFTEISFSGPTVTTPQEQTDTSRNTKVTVSAVPAGPFQGSGVYFYNRLNFSVLDLDNLTSFFSDSTNKTIGDVVDAINAQNDTGIAATDIANWSDVITQAQLLNGVTVQLQASATSLAWVGNANVTLASMKPQLTSVFNSNILAGITVAQITD